LIYYSTHRQRPTPTPLQHDFVQYYLEGEGVGEDEGYEGVRVWVRMKVMRG
jgi:hypothetical protein